MELIFFIVTGVIVGGIIMLLGYSLGFNAGQSAAEEDTRKKLMRQQRMVKKKATAAEPKTTLKMAIPETQAPASQQEELPAPVPVQKVTIPKPPQPAITPQIEKKTGTPCPSRSAPKTSANSKASSTSRCWFHCPARR